MNSNTKNISKAYRSTDTKKQNITTGGTLMNIYKSMTLGIIGSLLLSTAAYAATTCQSATVTKTGVNPAIATATRSQYTVTLDCDDDTLWVGARQYFLITDLGESGYATALTALSLGGKVRARLARSSEFSLLEDITVIATP